MKEMRMDDAMLESPAQDQMRELVSSLPEDSLSLSWRSELNEKLLASAQKSKQSKRISWVLRPTLGLAAAGALALVVVIRSGPTATTPMAQRSGLEAALVRDHRQTVELTDVVGAGLNPLESHPTSEVRVEGSDWSEVDFENL
jgi:hypothetical protein